MNAPQPSVPLTADELEPQLKAALELVERLNPPDDLRVAVFDVVAGELVRDSRRALLLQARARAAGRDVDRR